MPSWWSFRACSRRVLPTFGLAFLLAGCAAFRSYDAKLHSIVDQASSGNVDAAIRILESNNQIAKKDLLYQLELGMLQRLANRYSESQQTWMSANQRVESQTLLADVSNLAGTAASYLVNDKLRPYEGHDYEKVMLLTYMALNHLAMGDYENARVAIKQSHELESVIAEKRSKAIAELEEHAKRRGAATSFKELNGYPVETIDNPAVNALKNSYQSALSHYLAGFIYESLGELSLAAPGYRLANELQPNRPLLEEALRGLDERASVADDGMTDVLFLIATGTAPALQSRQFHVPMTSRDRLILVPISFPVLAATSMSRAPSQLALEDGRTLPVTPLTSIDLMARRSLKDDMPGIMLRVATRAAASAVMQYQAQRLGEKQDSAAAAVGLAAVAATAALLESADDRTWRMLPSEISIARARLPRGAHSVTLQTPEGVHSARLNLVGRYAVIDLRLLRHQMFVHAPPAVLAQIPRNRETPR